jgi:hypothetical protein
MAKKQKRQVSNTPVANPAPVQTVKRTITTGPADFNPDYAPVVKDLKRIGILAGSFFAVLIILTFILR